MALPTAEQIRSLVQKEISGTGLDTKLDTLIATADKVLAAYCLYPQTDDFLPSMDKDTDGSTHVFYLDGPERYDPRVVDVRCRPVVSTTSVKLDLSGDWTFATTLTSGTDYVAYPDGLYRVHPTGSYAWPSGYRPIRIEGVFGFDLSTEAPLTLAIALLVAHWWRLTPTPSNLVNMTQAGQTATYREPERIPAIVRQLVAPYRLIERETRPFRR